MDLTSRIPSRDFTASRITVRLTANISQSTGSIGRALPSGSSPPTMRSTRSSTTAVANRRGRRGQDGSAAGSRRPPSLVVVQRSSHPIIVLYRRQSLAVSQLDDIHITNYVS